MAIDPNTHFLIVYSALLGLQSVQGVDDVHTRGVVALLYAEILRPRPLQHSPLVVRRRLRRLLVRIICVLSTLA